ncbi:MULTISPECIES: heme exporter protein CcmD [unclassified Duganella]|uniref:heme exporter protein CcmD n=1 Tax=unclassified Duganella TaxID=2636909 RepID=UPI000E357A9F|nr:MULTISPECIES: heme exporter protein CcmD [unclassified Duganella]RFP09500.1 heme exporter protein CcmD [Duganella sp. BJB475]RFP27620.1 heme exporter protein CcmD [Duganella sp. BJB476]
MIWDSWSDLIAMGGYAKYVWGSFAVVAVVLVGEQVALALRHRSALKAARTAGESS